MEQIKKDRLDIIMVQRGLAVSREKAKLMIASKAVMVDGVKALKASQQTEYTADIRIDAPLLKYVSRGGLKLEKAIEVFNIVLKDKVCLDIGASTGGFTDCMLQNGAKKVFAVDVGTEQLAECLRADARVVSREKTNIRYCDYTDFAEKIDFISIDVSFISLTKIFDAVKRIAEGEPYKEGNGTEIICLIKPQFEAGRKNIGKHGIVKEPRVHKEVIREVIACAREKGFLIRGLETSPIKGGDGNIEYLLWLSCKKGYSLAESDLDLDIDAVVSRAYK